MAVEGVEEIKKNIGDIYDRRRAAIVGLAKDYAALMIQWFNKEQIGNRWWDNQTNDARKGMFSDGYLDGEDVVMGAAHMMQYGIYLELANNGEHAALRPMIVEWGIKYIKAVRALIEATS